MKAVDFKKATNKELRMIAYEDPFANKWDRAFALSELQRRNQKRMSGRVDKHAGVRR